MSLKEEELVLLFQAFESIAQDVVAQHMVVGEANLCIGNESATTSKLKQQCIDVIAFGEALDETQHF